MAGKPQITAEHIQGLLASRHAKDVFVPECKNGPSWGANMLRLDAWVLAKTWSPWTTIGYEVKVSRSDFEQDQKWPGYLPLCHLFYFVCPAGLIRATDLPEGVGLIWVGINGEKLHVKVKARHREPDMAKLTSLMSYALMSRSVIVGDMHEANQGEPPAPSTELRRVQAMADAAREAEARGGLAYFVREHIHNRVNAADDKLAQAERLMGQVQEFAGRLAKLGIAWDPTVGDWSDGYRVHREIDALVDAVDDSTLTSLERNGQTILKAVETVRQLREQRETKLALPSARELLGSTP